MYKIFLIVAFALLGSIGNAYAITEAKTNTLDLRGSTSGSVKLKAPAAGGAATYVLPGVDATVAGQALKSDGAGNLSWGEVGGWAKYTFAFGDAFAIAATTNDVELVSLPANTAIEAVIVKHSTAMSGGSITAYTASVGIAGDLEKYASDFNVFQAAADGTKQYSSSGDVESFSGATSIRFRATSTGGDLNTATAGEVDVWIKTSTFPAP